MSGSEDNMSGSKPIEESIKRSDKKSSIEERIQKHELLMQKYERKASNYRGWAIHNENKARYHLEKINKLTAKQEKKVD